jgi:hypothetical protein
MRRVRKDEEDHLEGNIRGVRSILYCGGNMTGTSIMTVWGEMAEFACTKRRLGLVWRGNVGCRETGSDVGMRNVVARRDGLA